MQFQTNKKHIFKGKKKKKKKKSSIGVHTPKIIQQSLEHSNNICNLCYLLKHN